MKGSPLISDVCEMEKSLELIAVSRQHITIQQRCVWRCDERCHILSGNKVNTGQKSARAWDHLSPDFAVRNYSQWSETVTLWKHQLEHLTFDLGRASDVDERRHPSSTEWLVDVTIPAKQSRPAVIEYMVGFWRYCMHQRRLSQGFDSQVFAY